MSVKSLSSQIEEIASMNAFIGNPAQSKLVNIARQVQALEKYNESLDAYLQEFATGLNNRGVIELQSYEYTE